LPLALRSAAAVPGLSPEVPAPIQSHCSRIRGDRGVSRSISAPHHPEASAIQTSDVKVPPALLQQFLAYFLVRLLALSPLSN